MSNFLGEKHLIKAFGGIVSLDVTNKETKDEEKIVGRIGSRGVDAWSVWCS